MDSKSANQDFCANFYKKMAFHWPIISHCIMLIQNLHSEFMDNTHVSNQTLVHPTRITLTELQETRAASQDIITRNI